MLMASTIHPDIFLGRPFWANSVSPLMNTNAERDQFQSISRIGEKFSGEIKVLIVCRNRIRGIRSKRQLSNLFAVANLHYQLS